MFLVFKRIYAFNDFNTIIVDEGQGRLKVDIVAIICRMFAVRIKLLNPKNKGLRVYDLKVYKPLFRVLYRQHILSTLKRYTQEYGY